MAGDTPWLRCGSSSGGRSVSANVAGLPSVRQHAERPNERRTTTRTACAEASEPREQAGSKPGPSLASTSDAEPPTGIAKTADVRTEDQVGDVRFFDCARGVMSDARKILGLEKLPVDTSIQPHLGPPPTSPRTSSAKLVEVARTPAPGRPRRHAPLAMNRNSIDPIVYANARLAGRRLAPSTRKVAGVVAEHLILRAGPSA